MRRSFARLAAAAGGALLTACSLLVDTSGLDGPGTRSGIGSPGGPEVGVDGAASDAETGSSQKDGAVAADGAPLPFCPSLSPAPAFCEDFDGETDPAGWTSSLSGGGALTRDDATSASFPRSLRATLPNPTAAPCKYASGTRELSLPFATRVRFGFSVRLGHVGQGGGVPDPVIPAELLLSNASGNDECGYYFLLRADRATLSLEGSSTQPFPLASGIAFGTWVRVELVVTKTGRASVTFDGTTVLNDAQLPAACGFGRIVQLDVGLICVQPGAGEGDVRIDDVTIHTE